MRTRGPCPPGELDESEKFEKNPGEFLVNAYGRGWADAEGSLMSARAWSTVLGRREAETARSAAGYVPSHVCLLYTSPSPRDATLSRMPSSA